jgi:hypothetical protein
MDFMESISMFGLFCCVPKFLLTCGFKNISTLDSTSSFGIRGRLGIHFSSVGKNIFGCSSFLNNDCKMAHQIYCLQAFFCSLECCFSI